MVDPGRGFGSVNNASIAGCMVLRARRMFFALSWYFSNRFLLGFLLDGGDYDGFNTHERIKHIKIMPEKVLDIQSHPWSGTRYEIHIIPAALLSCKPSM